MALRRGFAEHIDLAKDGPAPPWPIWRTLLVTSLIMTSLAAIALGAAWLLLRAIEL